jgi:hemerythrin superfamily protein
MPGRAHHVSQIHTALSTSSTVGRPLAGVFETLAEQHRQLLELLREAGSSAAAAQRRERWAEARRRLLSHERAESQVVYAALQRNESASRVLQQHAGQVTELERAVGALDSTDWGSEHWISRLRDVLALVDDHVRDEEQDFFPRAQRLLGEDAARALDEPFERAQRDILHTLTGKT